jgi:hypothetical protein
MRTSAWSEKSRDQATPSSKGRSLGAPVGNKGTSGREVCGLLKLRRSDKTQSARWQLALNVRREAPTPLRVLDFQPAGKTASTTLTKPL